LHLATERGHVEVIRELLSKGANVDTPDNKGWTPLHLAAKHGHVHSLRELLSKGGTVDIQKKMGGHLCI
jgi:ankyrin repeat protein